MNSWGVFNAGPKWPADQPDGSFWVSRETVDAMLAGQDSFSISGVNFKYRNLDHGGWLQPALPEKQASTPHTARLVANVHKLGL